MRTYTDNYYYGNSLFPACLGMNLRRDRSSDDRLYIIMKYANISFVFTFTKRTIIT